MQFQSYSSSAKLKQQTSFVIDLNELFILQKLFKLAPLIQTGSTHTNNKHKVLRKQDTSKQSNTGTQLYYFGALTAPLGYRTVKKFFLSLIRM